MQDPREIVDREPMSAFQKGVVAIMIGLNALDGFDVLSISFASPGIAAEWGIDRAALGIVLSMELFGMAIGSLTLGRVADRIGRHSTILGCLAVMATGMLGAATSHNVAALCCWRVVTGLGIGGMLASTNAAAAEAANAARRNLCVVLMAGGYPVGTVIGGSISTVLLSYYDWRAVFVFGGVVTIAFIPIVLFFTSESIAFLMHKRPADALQRINAALRRMRHPIVDRLPEAASEPARPPAIALFRGSFAAVTLLLTVAYLAHIMTFYFILKWIPKIVFDMGHSPSSAGGVLVWASLGGAIGSLALGLLTAHVRLITLTIAAMVASTVLVTLFGQGATGLGRLSLIAAVAGMATNAAVVGLYAMIAQSFPTSLRATATGLVIGIGRGGSALAPALAGALFAVGYGLQAVAFLMGLGSLVAAVFLSVLASIGKRS